MQELHVKETTLTGYVKGAPALINTLIENSGKHKVFADRLKADLDGKERLPVRWVPRETGETMLTYHARCVA